MAAEGYWALWTGEELAGVIRRKVNISQRHMLASGLWWLWVKAHGFMQGFGRDGYSSHHMEKKGKLGEYTSLNINHFRSIARRYRQLAYPQRPSLDPLADSTAPDADEQVKKVRELVDHYQRRGWEDIQTDVIRYAAYFGAAWEYKEWNPNMGAMVLPSRAPTDGDPGIEAEYAGDFRFWALKPNDVYFDPGLKSPRDIPWVILRLRMNRWDLMVDFPEHADAIRSQRQASIDRNVDFALVPGLNMPPPTQDEDLVCVYVFLHEDRRAVPGGRFAMCLSGGPLLMPPTELPAGVFPARMLHDDDFNDSAHGYATVWDLMGPQDYVNQSASIQASVQRAHGMGIIATPKGSDFEPSMLTRGLALLKYNPGLPKPELLNFTGTPAEVVEGRKDAVRDMESLSGVNAVARGEPQASLRTGPALVAVLAQASQFSEDFQKNIARYLSMSGEDFLEMFKELAGHGVPVTVLDGGRSRDTEVSGEDVLNVKGIKVDPGNPLAATLAGRMEIAAKMLELGVANGQPLDFGQYLRVVSTGKTEVLTDIETKKRNNVDRENELLARATVDPITGEITSPMPRALATDDLKIHVPGHLSKLDSPEARANPAVVRAVLTHCMEHIQSSTLAQMNTPALLEAAGLEPLQAIMGMMGMGAPAESGAGAQKRPGGPAPSTPAPGSMPGMPPDATQAATGINPMAPGPGPGPEA